MTELPEPGAGILAGLKLTLAPDGTPDAESVIALLNPPLTVVVIVDVPWLPWAMLSDAGLAAMVKVPLPVTVRPVLPLIELYVALIVVEPADTPVASPPLVIVATAGELEVQVAELVKF